MAKNYKIRFVSLRAGTTYILNIGGGSGDAVQLSGGAQPFTTDEDGSEDMFTNIRTQTGYFRIIDNACNYDGNVIDATAGQDWWKDLIPATDSDRPVTLTVGNTVVWQGFMQSQTFSGQLYGNPQEREFPVICPLGVLAGVDIDFNAGLKNFAYLLKTVCDTIDLKSGGSMSGGVITVNGVVHISDIYVQGGDDARQWLLTKIDWQNFASEDSNGVARAKYTIYDVLEDMCRFWGWTARTKGTALYLTCADDSAEQNFLKLNRTQLNTLAAATTDTTTGSIVAPTTVTLQDTAANPIFASTNQEDYQIQGPHRAVVKADCNEHDTVAQFAPKDIQDYMGDDYSWVPGGEDLVGYFTTTPKSASNQGSETMKVTTGTYGRIARRQIYQSTESESAVLGDMLMVLSDHDNTSPSIQLQTLRPMSFSKGSISLGGTAWMGAEPLQQEKNKYTIRMRLGIGMTRASAKWWYMAMETFNAIPTIYSGWSSTQNIFNVPLSGNTLKSTGTLFVEIFAGSMYIYPAIPVPEDTYGYVFIDIMGAHDYTNGNEIEAFEIANLEISYSRDSYQIPSSIGDVRPRELITKRVTSQEYTATNSNASKDEWNANCIFASDNNMEYGYGLLLNASGNIIQTVNYGNNAEHPEQHLATRVANYWATAKRKIDGELLANMIPAVDPTNIVKVGIDTVTTYAPIAISREWRDDITKISLMQL